ncbi:MAG: NAD(P)H-hydrate dehydratase [Hyphomonadaceae bacterium]|nr:NAD(P)H-hydrate dehydratase [Hyphomonadaceae bacterium]
MTLENSPSLWRDAFPIPADNAHKYDRGHLVVFGAERFTGATRLAAESASRIGSGLVTVLSDQQAPTYRSTLPADIMVSEEGLSAINQPSALLAGPGGCSDAQAETLKSADPSVPIILDADAIRLLAEVPSRSNTIVTPHEGEFTRYFGPLRANRKAAAQRAAADFNCVVVLKGPETIIASPDGETVINVTASPYLAKAGTGDVLAGMIAGLVAQGMPPFDAACAGVWLHGKAGQDIGIGLIPQDLIQTLPTLLRGVLS